MDQTFITIHNLGPDANILFASESIVDILGYQPAEVQGKSCFDYFHPDEIPFARSVHSRGVLLDKAAVLHYARILSRDGRWIGCECCFTIVHDVLVACTSIYRRSAKSERRAIEAPQIRRIFSCSPRDPRYHMLEHLSPKFKMPPMEREPRAALILNRFTRNLTVMFATTSITSVLGLRPNEIRNRGFYRCIQENCLAEAIECLESAKANDSIAYLRFFFQDPREDDELIDAMVDNNSSSSNNNNNSSIIGEDQEMVDAEDSERRQLSNSPADPLANAEVEESSMVDIKIEEDDTHISLPAVPLVSGRATPVSPTRLPSIELEAVVSCTSDGLVVILRKARPPIPPAHPPLVAFDYGEGLFAAPWGQQPIRPHFPHESIYTFRPPLLPQYMPLRDNVRDAGGPPLDVLMGSIRDVAVFAWGVVGINPALATYGRGLPSGEARPTLKSRPNGSQTRNAADDCGNAKDAPSTTGQNKGKAPQTVALTARPHEYSSRRPRSHASYNALDPVVGGTSRSSCGFQSAWPDSANSSWGLSHYRLGATASSRSDPSQVQQASNPNLYPTSNASVPCLASSSRDTVYNHQTSQNTPPSSSSSFGDYKYVWH